MDGLKKRLDESIEFRLSFSLSVAIFCIAVIAGIFSFVSAYFEAHELQDDTLRQIATLVEKQQLAFDQRGDNIAADVHEEESRVIVAYLPGTSNSFASSSAKIASQLPKNIVDGFHTVDIDNEPFRILIKKIGTAERIAIAQQTAVRNEIAVDSAFRTLLPLLILIPILILLVTRRVRKMLSPILQLSTEIDHRSEHDLHPVDETHLPNEIRPFIRAINHLLLRIKIAMGVQQRFITDAAHELKTPLTALSLQAERMLVGEMPLATKQHFQLFMKGIEKNRNLIDKLLGLARARSTMRQPVGLISVHSVYREILEEFMPLVEQKRIDIGVIGELDSFLWIDEFDLISMIKNLVDNAIRYTPENGKIDLYVRETNTTISLYIQDTGPGIKLEERLRIFDPFYRVLGNDQIGSGIGLSIVKAISDRLGAQITLEFLDNERQSGTRIGIEIPKRNR